MMLRIGLVGCGNIAKIHLPFILDNKQVEEVALCDQDELRLRLFLDEQDYTGLARYTSLKEMLDEFRPDVVHVLTQPMAHAEVAIKALQDGAHVLIEKPMCLSVEEGKAIIEAARASSCKVCIDHNWLYDPKVLRMKQVLKSGVLGEVVRVQSVSFDDYLERRASGQSAVWAANLPGGPVFDFLPHSLYLMAEFLPGLEFSDAHATAWKDGIPRHLFASFASPAGAADLYISLAMRPLQHSLHLWCTKGTVFIDFRNFGVRIQPYKPMPSALSRIYNNLRTSVQTLRYTISSGLSFLTGNLDTSGGIREIIARFYKAVESDTPSPVPAEEGLSVAWLTERIFAYLAQTRHRVVLSKSMPPNKKDGRESARGTARILVTGGTGFIGSHLVSRLVKSGERVRVLCRKTSDLSALPKDGVEVFYGDVRDCSSLNNALEGTDLVYHLAAAMQGNWLTYLDTTVGGTRNLLAAARQCDVRKLVYVSSLSVLDAIRYPDGGEIDETFSYEQRPKLRGNYSRAKMEAERLVHQSASDPTGPAVVILRPGLVYGPRGPSYIADVGYFVREKVFIVPGKGRRLLPLAYVENLVDALVLSGQSDQADGRIYNVVDANPPTQREYLAKYKAITGIKAQVFYLPLFLLSAGLRTLQWGISLLPGISASALTYRLRCNSRSVRYSTARIEEEIDWQTRISLDEALRRTLVEDKV